jgi:hypothetical protein
MQAIGLCRFSYPAIGGFQIEHDTVEERIAYLYGEARLEERFRLFESVALPCLKAQTDPDFNLIIVIGDQFPAHHLTRLEKMIAEFPQALIHQEPPRNQREVMKEILNGARLDPSEPCLQFRYDDDDAISVDFIENLRKAAQDCAPLLRQHKTVAFDWNVGYVAEFGAHGIRATKTFRQFYTAALGMYVKGNCPITIMNFAHDKLPKFMPAVSFSETPMWVRSHNTSNDSRANQTRLMAVKDLTPNQEVIFRERFAIDIDHVRRVFSAS